MYKYLVRNKFPSEFLVINITYIKQNGLFKVYIDAPFMNMV